MTSDLVPYLGELVDDMCFIHSLTGETNTHGPGCVFMNTGHATEGFPSAALMLESYAGPEALAEEVGPEFAVTPMDLEFDPGGRYLYVACEDEYGAVVDVDRLEVLPATWKDARCVTCLPDGSRLYTGGRGQVVTVFGFRNQD